MRAKYTVVLKDLLDDDFVKAKIDKALSTYPIYVQKTIPSLKEIFIPTREEINKKLLDHYKYREIGFETVGRFIDELEISMNEIMPYYNELMMSADYDFNIIFNVDYEKKIEIDKTGESSSEMKSKDDSSTEHQNISSVRSEGSDITYGKKVNTETPQNNLNLPKTEGIDSVNHADNVDWSKGTANSENQTDGTDTGTSSVRGNASAETSGQNTEKESHSEVTKGNYGQVSYQSLIRQYREIIVNIVQKIINDRRITELFMGVY